MTNDRTLLFVGRTGNGKSSIANSLIGEHFFGTRKDDLSINQRTIEKDQSRITVVDGTGIGDTGADMDGDIQDTIQRAEEAVIVCGSGFNALIFVMAYGTRFTKQERDSVDLIRSLFGKDIFRRFGVIVMSRGDQFEMDIEDEPKTFDQWCREQTGAIRDLFQECYYRILIFNNRSTDKKKLDRQRNDLLKLVNGEIKYSLKNFTRANYDRETLLLAHDFKAAEKEHQTFLQHIDKKLVYINLLKDDKQIYEILSGLTLDIDNKIKDLEQNFRGDKFRSQLLIPLQTRAANVNSKIRTLSQIEQANHSQKHVKRYLDQHENGKKRRRTWHQQSQENLVNPRMKCEVNTISETYLNQISNKEGEKIVLIVGRTGNGKSSTANSIIGEQFFGTKTNQLNILGRNVEVEGSNVTVVDGTGIGDTGSDMNGDMQDTIQRAVTAVRQFESGFNALIFVMAYGTRFTKQERDSVDLIRSLFGKDIFRRFGVIVMSRGDQFEMDTEDEPKTFKQWCGEQTGAIRDLFQECDYRILIFNNRSTDKKKLDRQRNDLLNLVNGEIKYSLENFTRANYDRESLLLAHDFKAAEKENQTFLQHIDKKLVYINLLKDDKQIYEILSGLTLDIDNKIKDLEQNFRGDKFRSQLLIPLQTRAANVNSKKRTLSQLVQPKVSQETVEKKLDQNDSGEKRRRTWHGQSQVNLVNPSIKSEINTISGTYLNQISNKEDGKILLFVGRTGNGKSSTANSIIGEQFFGTKTNQFNILGRNVEIEGSNVTVVDGTGIGDTGSDMSGDIQDTIQRAEEAVQLCESGFNALIFVMAYGTRFTKQERDAVDLIRSLFGKDIFSSFGVIVMSRGDQFERDIEDEPKTFKHWCREQTGAIRDLFQECEYKTVLFNNRSKDNKRIDQQRRKLLSLVSDDNKYSLKDFKSVNNFHQELIIHDCFLEAEEENNKFLQDLDKQINYIESYKGTQLYLEELTKMSLVLKDKIESIKVKFSGSELFSALLTPLETRSLKVNSKIRFEQDCMQTSTLGYNDDDGYPVAEMKNHDSRRLPQPSQNVITKKNLLHNKITPLLDKSNHLSKESLPEALDPENNKVILLVGRTGNGKSSIANSLIGEQFFGNEIDGPIIQKTNIKIDCSEVIVVDGTGIGDTGADMDGDIQDTIQRAEEAVKLCESGFNALIFVMAYGTRFTKQERDSVDLIRSLFGKDIFRRFGVIVMSRGDQFEMDTQDEPKTFDQWCKEQTGAIRDLFKECKNRILIFNNKIRDKETLDKQRHNLLTLVPKEFKYSFDTFKNACNDRETLLLDQDFKAAEKANQVFLQRIDNSLVDIDLFKDYNQIYKELSSLNVEIEEKIKVIELKFREANFKNKLVTPLETRAANVNSKMRKLNTMAFATVSQTHVERHLDQHEIGRKNVRSLQKQSKENQVDARKKSEINTMSESYLNPMSKKEMKLTTGHSDDGSHSVTEVKSQGTRKLPQPSQARENTNLASTDGRLSDPNRKTEGHESGLKSDGRSKAWCQTRLKEVSQDRGLPHGYQDRRQPPVTQQPKKAPANNAPEPRTSCQCYCCSCSQSQCYICTSSKRLWYFFTCSQSQCSCCACSERRCCCCTCCMNIE